MWLMRGKLFYFKTFKIAQNLPFPTFVNMETASWRNLLSIKIEATSLVALHGKELWLVQENHATVMLGSVGIDPLEFPIGTLP